MHPKTPSWRLEDLIDLEYFLYQDETRADGPDKTSRHREERAFFIESIEPILNTANVPTHEANRLTLRKWLDFCRKNETGDAPHEQVLPGDIFRQTYTFLIMVLLVFGFVSGWGLAFSFLAYKGSAPLNVSAYLGLFVISQMLLVVLVFVYLIITRIARRPPGFSLVRLGVSTLLVKLSLWLKKRSERHFSAEKRRNFMAALGVIQGKSRNYTALFPWPVFILTQGFAVFFNIGVLTATLLRVVGSDLAFGWQSTLQLSGNAVHKAVMFLSLPWSWGIPPSLAHPTLSQIEGSRIILKDGIIQLSTPDLTAWWPFLCFAVLFYGLVPRVLLLTGALLLQKRAMKRLRFSSIAFDRLFVRLQSPALTTQGEPQTPGRHLRLTRPSEPYPERTAGHRPIIALVPDDLFDDCPDQELEARLKTLFGSPLLKKISVSLDRNSDQPTIEGLIHESGGRLVLLMEAWQPPIREIIEYIRLLRDLGGADFRIHILLTGTPTDQTLFTRPNDHDIMVWQQGIKALGDPFIALEQP